MSGVLSMLTGCTYSAVPGDPTIGAAAATSSTTASVAYTAPVSNGGSTITLYTATSSPSGITGTVSQSGSGTITVSGLNGNTTYTFTVRATNAIGQSAASTASNSITTTPEIGQAYGGGFFAGQISTSANGVATHNLVISPKSTGQSTGKWGTVTGTGIQSVIDGPGNTTALNALGANYVAAQFCENLNTGGYTDWYLPAKNELITLYYFLKPEAKENNTNSNGSNANAVSPQPISTFFTSSTPAQTSVKAFKSGGSEHIFDDTYGTWSSTEYAGEMTAAWLLYMTGFTTSGGMGGQVKTYTPVYCRAVRRVAI